MKTLVIILAQGQQSRLPDLTLAKQLLPLAACGHVPILVRTLGQLVAMGVHPPMTFDVRDGSPVDLAGTAFVRVVTWLPVVEALCASGSVSFLPSFTILPDPGNSSLKGLAAALEHHAVRSDLAQVGRVAVLLGDVVYSWRCLRAIMGPSVVEHGEGVGAVFVHTKDLSVDAGELWGFSWPMREHRLMVSALAQALESHPAFKAYQPGQLRRLMWQVRKRNAPVQIVIDDYTRDVDLPEHVAALPELSKLAAEDDARNGLHWRE